MSVCFPQPIKVQNIKKKEKEIPVCFITQRDAPAFSFIIFQMAFLPIAWVSNYLEMITAIFFTLDMQW